MPFVLATFLLLLGPGSAICDFRLEFTFTNFYETDLLLRCKAQGVSTKTHQLFIVCTPRTNTHSANTDRICVLFIIHQLNGQRKTRLISVHLHMKCFNFWPFRPRCKRMKNHMKHIQLAIQMQTQHTR